MPQQQSQAVVTANRPHGLSALLPPMTLLGFAVAVLAVIVVSLFSFQSNQSRSEAADAVSRALETIQRAQSMMTAVRDAETGQRGYMLTGQERYLSPFEAGRTALPQRLRDLRQLSLGNARLTAQVDELERLSTEKMEELTQTVTLRRNGNPDAAMALVRTDRGKDVMDRLRAVALELATEQRAEFQRRRDEWSEAVNTSTLVTAGGAALLLALIGAAAVMTSRDYRTREREAWLRQGLAGLSSRLQGDMRLDRLGEQIINFLARYMGAQVGAIHVRLPDGRFWRAAAYATTVSSDTENLQPGDGLLGQAAKDRAPLHVRDVPPGYLAVSSSLGKSAPVELLLSPAIVDGVAQCVIELGFFRKVDAADRELLERIAETVAMATRASKDRTRLEELLEETQRQSEELQTQQEELRVNNEELEEQSRALRESQARLEQQQVELEQSNSQLEEQTQQLEIQRDGLAYAQLETQQKATDLERANQYKSEFLANMSHELRTPLNSTLILAKLLADNKPGNLSPEQVKFAQTIASAGKDLLTLINDILDLSKIEAGKVEVSLERVGVRRMVESLGSGVEPLARQRGLDFSVRVDAAVPDEMVTDESRCGQILKNLLSNAIKFTEAGAVTLEVSRATSGMLRFDVRDSGIGIAEHQREIIFEAFRQADGSTHRKYGGTGLGLSIARDLARLLGGDITVQSAPGQGSVFTLTLPPEGPPSDGSLPRVPPAPVGALREPRETREARMPKPPAPPLADDRAALNAETRMILVIEDDQRFAEILRDLIREQGFQCVLTHNAADGLEAAQAYRPSAILLDMNLPDHSGLGVLDQLKRNSLTRHIPVHVVSVADYSQEAMNMGAVGYALKPVRREELVEALENLQARFTQSLHRVLVVEDDARQRESVQHLLTTDDVQILGAESAADALRQLQATTFDCMVLDLNLPDLSGYELLEKMSQQDGVSFPPVIVYTGQPLSSEQEQRLRRFSKSIIIKDARSPERLLDEVTLFLHQVEAKLPADRQRMLKAARDREAALEGRRVLVVEDDVRNIFALSAVLEPKGVKVEIARNGREALEVLGRETETPGSGGAGIDLVLMDIMMPEMDGLTCMREIRKRPEWKKLPIIALTAKAMKDDQEKCLAAGANDYIAKPLDVEKLLSLVRVWMSR